MATKRRVKTDAAKIESEAKQGNKEATAPVLSRFVLGETSFQADGISVIKIGTKHLKLPIRSIGIMELKAELDADAPKPPKSLKKILKGSEQAKVLGVSEDSGIVIFDATDEDYLKAYAEYKTDMVWRLLILALAVDFVEKDSETPITDFQKKKAALENSGITGAHLDQILTDIMSLTSDSESVADFLSGNAWA